MRIRTVLLALMIGASSGAVLAQSAAIKQREDLMKGNNDGAKAVVAMMRGQRPFDSKAVEAVFAQWTETAQKLPGLFPEDSRTGGDTRASPTIWLNKDDFDSRAAAFGKAVAENRAKAVASLDGLKAAVPVVGKACDHCHDDYRMAKR